MFKRFLFQSFVAVCAVALLATGALAVTMDYVTVGNPGNAADTVAFQAGSVAYTYQISKYEVTIGQYLEFLNAKATSGDPYGLYNAPMANTNTLTPCGIVQNDIFGTYSYTLSNADWVNHPVAYVDFWDTLRFTNWMHNGQGAGDTETGSYTITTEGITGNTIVRNSGATVVVASNDEWHKAAYYDPAQPYYYDYATSSDTQPMHDIIDPDPGNNSNNWDGVGGNVNLTDVGEFENSDSPYGTFDQTGNVREWTDTIEWADGRIIRDGPRNWFPATSSSLIQFYPESTIANDNGLGFRVVLLTPSEDIPGDANHDGKVDAADVSIMAANWGAGSATWEMGDFNGDFAVGPDDAKMLAQNWGSGTIESAGAAAVPEPSCLALVLLGLAMVLGKRRSR